jgi:hypothetical protein
MKRYSIIGPPGTGKTTEIINRIKKYLKSGVKQQKIGLTTFSKSAALELAKRSNLTSNYIGTLHSMAFRIAEMHRDSVFTGDVVKEFGEHIGFPISCGNVIDGDQNIEIGDELLAIYMVAASKMENWKDAYAASNRPADFSVFEYFCKGINDYKKYWGYQDFNDMLRMAIDSEEIPKLDVLFVDEAQDLSPLQWELVDKWTEIIPAVHIAGDDDQCQPSGTMILTPDGEVPIEKLKNGDEVVSYNLKNKLFISQKIKITSRLYNGINIAIKTKNRISSYTANHKCMVKWKDSEDIFECRARWLNSELHQLAEFNGDSLNWCDFKRVDTPSNQRVYSLDVEKTSTYIADGIYTHNCIYSWGGADPEGIAKWENKWDAERNILTQSYRVPAKVHEISTQILAQIKERIEKTYKPKSTEGSFSMAADLAYLDIKHGEETVILYRNHFIRNDFEDVLIDDGLPYTVISGKPSWFNTQYANCVRAFIKAQHQSIHYNGQFQLTKPLRYGKKWMLPQIFHQITEKGKIPEEHWSDYFQSGPYMRYLLKVDHGKNYPNNFPFHNSWF